MKVGIISMQRIINYGSYLQAYSLKSTLEELGHQVSFVDYTIEPAIVEKEENEYVPPKKKNIFQKTINYLWEHRSAKSRKLRTYYRSEMYLKQRFMEEYFNELGVTPEFHYRTKQDVIVIGSDEVFNCLQSNPEVGYSKELFGKYANADKVITYAASFGTTTTKGLEKYGIKEEVAGMLKQLDAISIRDLNSKQIINELAHIEPEYHVDPVFIYDYEGKVPAEVPLKNYIIVYAYGERITEEEASVINDFAKKHGKKIVTIGGTQRPEWEHLLLSPFEVLAYFQHADYIITDTFHGSVFSIKYSKKFATIIREGNKQKLTDLLKRFGLEQRVVKDISRLEEVVTAQVDFAPVQQKIKEEKEKSITYLKSSIL